MEKNTSIPTFSEFVNEAEMLGDIKVERMDGGWKLSTQSKLGRGMQVIVISDAYLPDLMKILSKK
jgi:hypothetical protein